MMRHLPFLLTLFPLTLHAQGWGVNQPVDQQLSAITVYGGGCFPAIQAQLNFGQPPVDGVTYYYKVVGITTDGEYTMVPGPGQALAVNDLVPVQQFEHQVYNSGTFGGLELEVWAMGTPTTPGQSHPCSSSDLWMSNLLLCNEGLTCLIGSNCTTQLSTGVPGSARNNALVLPNAFNGYTLQWNGTPLVSGSVIDPSGRTIQVLSAATPTAQLGHLPSGVYILHLITTDGNWQRMTFPIVH